MIKIKICLFILLISVFSNTVLAQDSVTEIVIGKPSIDIQVQPNMYGIFFEDINFAADGGLYAELIKNRSFEFPNSPFMGWITYGKVEVTTDDAPFERNPHYARLTNSGLLTGTGLMNEGFRGIGIKQGDNYTLSFYARNVDADESKLKIELYSSATEIVGNGEITVNSKEWSKYELVLTASVTDTHAKLRIDLNSFGTIDLEHVSLFPVETYKGRKNGMRQDLAQALDDLNPGVFRFPGGCIIEGNTLETRYQWKNSVGPVENRPLNENRWNYVFQHKFTPDYFQSYGLGFYEYFLLCEDFGADALPVISCGMACQFVTENHQHLDDIEPYVQDALDLIEFANGPTNSTWGKVRSEMGHPWSFDLKMIAVGNEQWGEEFPLYLEKFIAAIRAKYPEIKIIGSSGPYPDGKEFDYLWPEMKRLKADLVDEHYYRPAEWFLANAGRYDSYDRNGPKVFAGEYACHIQPDKKNSFYSALCEAAFLTGIERNADVVHLATYAPLFAHVDAWQWKPDMIWFDNLRSVKSANYYIQQLYSHYSGTNVLSATSEDKILKGENGLYASAVVDKNKNQLIIKIANTSEQKKLVAFNLNDLPKTNYSGKHITLHANKTDENTLDNPYLVVPVENNFDVKNKKISVKLQAESFHVLVINLNQKK